MKGRRGGIEKGGWGDELGVQPRHPGRSESPPGGREEKGAAAADALPAAQRRAPEDLQGPERGDVRSRPRLGKGTGFLPELVGNWGSGESRVAVSCRCCFKLFSLEKLKNQRQF